MWILAWIAALVTALVTWLFFRTRRPVLQTTAPRHTAVGRLNRPGQHSSLIVAPPHGGSECVRRCCSAETQPSIDGGGSAWAHGDGSARGGSHPAGMTPTPMAAFTVLKQHGTLGTHQTPSPIRTGLLPLDAAAYAPLPTVSGMDLLPHAPLAATHRMESQAVFPAEQATFGPSSSAPLLAARRVTFAAVDTPSPAAQMGVEDMEMDITPEPKVHVFEAAHQPSEPAADQRVEIPRKRKVCYSTPSL